MFGMRWYDAARKNAILLFVRQKYSWQLWKATVLAKLMTTGCFTPWSVPVPSLFTVYLTPLFLTAWFFCRRLLSNNAVSVTDVAEAAGFCSRTHFCTVFRRLTGKTPTDYRNRK